MMKAVVASCSLCIVLTLAGCADAGRSRDRPARDTYDSDGPRPVSAIHGYLDVRGRSDKQLAEVEASLHLTPRQQVFWDAYQAKVSAFVADQTRVDLNTPEKRGALNRINAKIDQARDRLAAMEDIGDAAKALYLSLDEGQKAIADQHLPETIPGNFAGGGYSAEDDHQNDATQQGRHQRGQGRSGANPNGSHGNLPQDW